MSDLDHTFYWHDYETFGRVPRRDRPAQFAGVRTDADLNEIGEPTMVYCQPAPDYLPDPESCLLTGILPQTCLAEGVPEHRFASIIEAELALPGTVGVGYNSIRFDDEVTRHLFWRNLIDPYAREWQNQCGRWDILDVVRATYALRPDGIEWPKHEDGRPSFKLEHLTKANGLAHVAAHDALSDVRATIALARLIKSKQPRLWDFCVKLRRKDEVIREMGVGKPFLHISGMYGTERGGMALVWPLAPHPTNKNEVIVWDLASDPTELLDLDVETLRLRMFSKTEALPEGVTRLPIKTLHINKSPIVVGNDDRRNLTRLRGLSPSQLADKRPAFADPRLEELLFRYRARNFPDTLSDEEQQQWRQHCAARLHDGAGGAFTLDAFFERVEALEPEADDRGQDILGALVDYATEIAPDR